MKLVYDLMMFKLKRNCNTTGHLTSQQTIYNASYMSISTYLIGKSIKLMYSVVKYNEFSKH
jgi:hypothetical protein